MPDREAMLAICGICLLRQRAQMPLTRLIFHALVNEQTAIALLTFALPVARQLVVALWQK